MNIAIHGERELLARMANDISNVYEVLSKQHDNPLILGVYIDLGAADLYGHEGFGFNKRLLLTPSNYNEILNIIIERKDEK